MRSNIILIIVVIIIAISLLIYFSKSNFSKSTETFSAKIDTINTNITKNNIDLGKNINLPLYYINLERSKDRRDNITKKLKNSSVNFKRVEGVDGHKLDLKKGTYRFENGKVLNYSIDGFYNYKKTELGCLMSHLIAINTAYEAGDENALIIEDDVYLGISSCWKEDLKTLISSVPSDWGAIQLFTSLIYKKVKDCENYTNWENYYGAVAYIVNRKFMKIISEFFNGENFTLTNNNDVSIVADWFIYNYSKKNKLGVYTVFPRFIPNNIKLESTIHQDHTQEHITQSSRIIDNYVINVKEQGRAIEYGGNLINLLLEKTYGKPVSNNTSDNPSIYVNSHFGRSLNRKPYITWSGESYRVKNDNDSLLNILSFTSKGENDIWVPFILFKLDEDKISKLKNKNFKKITERQNFLAYINSNCVKKRENLFSEILKLRPDAHALGKCSNNKKLREKDYNNNDTVLENYRFAMVLENLDKDGYITEKILNAYSAGAIPIYSGGKNTAEKFFKKGTYIDVNSFKSLKDCAEFVCELDKNLNRLQEIQDTNIFKNDEVPEMFLWYEKNNPFMENLGNTLKGKFKL